MAGRFIDKLNHVSVTFLFLNRVDDWATYSCLVVDPSDKSRKLVHGIKYQQTRSILRFSPWLPSNAFYRVASSPTLPHLRCKLKRSTRTSLVVGWSRTILLLPILSLRKSFCKSKCPSSQTHRYYFINHSSHFHLWDYHDDSQSWSFPACSGFAKYTCPFTYPSDL